jgi:thiol-disulfide isomerase/thioredoxin
MVHPRRPAIPAVEDGLNETGEKKKRKIASWLRITGEVMLFFLLVSAVQWWSSRDVVGSQAPELNGVTLSGEPFSLRQFRGRPALIHFWASWCPVCRAEEDMIEDLAAELPVITIAMQSGGAAEVRAYMRGRQLDFPVLNDPQGVLAARYGVRGVPVSFIIDARGRIRFVESGFTTGWGIRARLWLARVLGDD